MPDLLVCSSRSSLAATPALAQFDQPHKAWDALLKKHVVLVDGGKASQVRYAGIATDRAALQGGARRVLARWTRRSSKSWSKAEQLAFLINAYNANTVEKILTRYPEIKSIWDFGKVVRQPVQGQLLQALRPAT